MAWAGNITLYDTYGVARRSLRYSLDAAGDDVEQFVARMVDEVASLIEGRHVPPLAAG